VRTLPVFFGAIAREDQQRLSEVMRRIVCLQVEGCQAKTDVGLFLGGMLITVDYFLTTALNGDITEKFANYQGILKLVSASAPP
jgi:hypothetical protein